MQSTTQSLAVALRETPLRFRAMLGSGAGVVLLGYASVLWLSSPAELLMQPGFWLLAVLVLLADLYPLVPSMRDVRASVTFAWSAALSLAAVLAYGPTASLLFLVSGLTAALSRRTGRWWQVALNMIVFGLIGLVMAGFSAVAAEPTAPTPGWLVGWGLLLAVVVVVLYALLIGLAMTSLGVSTWRAQRVRFGKSVRIWGVSLITAPLLAALALTGPWALPSMAVVIIALNHLSSTMFRSTAASRTDSLTGLANRLTLTRSLSARIAQLAGSEPVTLMLIDLDRFKEVNDTHGHLVGDEVLITVAQRLRAAAAPADLVARYGGDEFAVVLGRAGTPDQIASAAQTFRAALAEPITIGDVQVRIGGSVGISAADDPTIDVLGLLEQADQDLYRAKRGDPTRSANQQIQAPPGRPPAIVRPAPFRRFKDPIWSMTVQGAAATPAAGWPGVQWSWSRWPGLAVVQAADAGRGQFTNLPFQGG